MRVFFALEFDTDIKKRIKEQQQIIISNSKSGNFTSEGNFHLTLKYIGEIKEEKLDYLKEILNKTVENTLPFCIVVNALGYFLRSNRKIIWLGINENKELNTLFRDLEDGLLTIGIEKDTRGYNPHITLGREVILKDNFKSLQDLLYFNEEVFIKKISLMESTRFNDKLVYQSIFSVQLQ